MGTCFGRPMVDQPPMPTRARHGFCAHRVRRHQPRGFGQEPHHDAARAAGAEENSVPVLNGESDRVLVWLAKFIAFFPKHDPGPFIQPTGSLPSGQTYVTYVT